MCAISECLFIVFLPFSIVIYSIIYFQWKWQANTLNPYYEGNPLSCMINDDRFILQTLENWKFGIDYTGDLMKLENMKSLVEDAEQMGNVLLVSLLYVLYFIFI